MTETKTDRRKFIQAITGSAAVLFALPKKAFGSFVTNRERNQTPPKTPARIKFAAIGINHDHINGQVNAVIRGGGELGSFYAKEPDLAAAFIKRFTNNVRGTTRRMELVGERNALRVPSP